MTDRLYYRDSYLTRFQARVVDTNPERTRVYLDRTAFYPTSGGQPFDTGTLGGVTVTDVIDEGERIAHVTAAPVEDDEVECAIDEARRFDHMRQHTGQHLLSAVFIEVLDAPTVSFHLGADACTIDIQRDALNAEEVRAVEKRANELVMENRPVTVEFRVAAEDLGLRKATDRTGEVRVVTIAGLDRSACGGTHVRATGEIGPILIRKLDRIRGIVRVEFLCGGRAIARARADFDALAGVCRVFSCPLDEAPTQASGQQERLQTAEKSRARLAGELARIEGRELWRSTEPRASGRRIAVRNVPALTEEVRVLAQSFVASEAACFIALASGPPGILLAASVDSGIHAGNVLKAALVKHGGRGGGNAVLAQGSVPSREQLEEVRADIETELS
jgi:alanyl-tRNA synthetase